MLASLINFTFLVAQATTANGDGGGEATSESTTSSGLFGGGTTTIIFYIAAFVAIFYFLIIRPGQKQKKAHKELVESLKKGDEVMTAGGIFGTITQVKSDHVMVEIAKKTEIKVSRNSISRISRPEEEEEEEEVEEEEVEEETEEEAS